MTPSSRCSKASNKNEPGNALPCGSERLGHLTVGIMLFAPDGAKKEDWPILLFNPANNTQAINADTNGDGSGAEAYDLSIPEITKLEEEFVRKVIDTVHDLDNVLFEIGNEGDRTSVRWQHHSSDSSTITRGASRSNIRLG